MYQHMYKHQAVLSLFFNSPFHQINNGSFDTRQHGISTMTDSVIGLLKPTDSGPCPEGPDLRGQPESESLLVETKNASCSSLVI